MIKAVIFDCFGVLVRDGWLPFCERHFGTKPECMSRAHEINHQIDSGMIEYGDYIGELAELAGITPKEVQKEIATNPPNTELFGWIREELKPKYKIGLLSNAGDNWLDGLFGAKNVELFDAVVLSYQIGAVKPDPRMYEAIVDKLGVEPSDCLFVDDQSHYCEAAKAFGMQAIVYKDNPQLVTSFKNYNILLKNY